jgi:hypothetical protein
MKKKSIPSKIPVHDLNFSAYQLLHGNVPDLIMQGTRVIFLFNADDAFQQLSERYNQNETVKVLDFVNTTRQLRAMMLSMRNRQK